MKVIFNLFNKNYFVQITRLLRCLHSIYFIPVRPWEVVPAGRCLVMGTTAGVWACASESSTAHWVKQNVHR